MRQLLVLIGIITAALVGVVLLFTFIQLAQTRSSLTSDLEYRTSILADNIRASVEDAVREGDRAKAKSMIDRLGVRSGTIGVAVYGQDGAPLAVSEGFPDSAGSLAPVASAIQKGVPSGAFSNTAGGSIYTYALPVFRDAEVAGAVAVVESAGYIDASTARVWRENLIRLLTQSILFLFAIAIIIRFILLRPVLRFTEALKSARGGDIDAINPLKQSFFFRPLASEVDKLAQSLRRARSAAEEEARLRFEQLDASWTSERLKEFVKNRLKNRAIYVVSNREPYVHERVNGTIRFSVPASGMVTALESLMEACGGTWLAHGGGSADREVTDEEGRVAVPPDEPRYTLKRVWLDEDDVKGFYTGFSNEALWPLCHMAHTRPVFRHDDWIAYRRVNGAFAEQLLAEIKNVERPIILIQDFHFALLPRMIKKSRPDAQIGIFWHIPWPSAEHFSICPWRKEIVDGMLGADVVGFHTQQYCNNFMETVGREIESLMDYEHFTVTKEGHVSHIEPFPISIAFAGGNGKRPEPDKKILERLGIRSELLCLGVDRLDYTKGILERLKAFEFLLETHPEYHERATFLQIAPPSRESVEKYREYGAQVASEVERINRRFGTPQWRPIVFENRNYTHKELDHIYRLADMLAVTSLHDGMNLVAKEYIAARDDEAGVLVLSQFTGASRDLKGAIIVNPYSAEETAEAYHQALTMPPTEQHRRMKAMRDAVRDYNVYRWSAEFLAATAHAQ